MIETYNIVHDAKCDTCVDIASCFQWYELNESGKSQVVLTQCGEKCDLKTDPRGAEAKETPENWRA